MTTSKVHNGLQVVDGSAETDGFLARAWSALDVALQPIVNMRAGDVYAYEAFMRGCEKIDFESIGDVLDYAHERGIADRLYLLLMDKAFAKLKQVEDDEDHVLFFNLDGRALACNSELHKETKALLDKYGIEPGVLCLEFAETYDYASASEVARMVADHRRMGIRFAIDDFGRGFSELKALYEYNPEFIKIDRFFVSGMVSDSRKRLFVSTLVNLTHVLGIRVIAEGIETAEEYDVCWQLGCDFAQGYFIAPPSSAVADLHDVPNSRLQKIVRSLAAPKADEFVFDRVRALKTAQVDDNLTDTIDAFCTWKDQTIIPVTNSLNEPVGLLLESDMKQFIYSPFGRDLLKNSALNDNLRAYVRKCPIAEVSSPASEILDTFSYHPEAEGVLLTENSKYVGFLSAVALLEIIGDKRVEAARDQNPLSKLPGNVTINNYSESIIKSTEYDRYFCYFDFDNFKPFNDNYSFLDGDRAIVIFADLLRKYFKGPRYMVGHIGGDDFFVGAHDVDEKQMERLLIEVTSEFAKSVESLYTAEDRGRGYIQSRDRFGELRQFPLLGCSVAMVEVAAGVEMDTVDGLLAQITSSKSKAKKSKTGVHVAKFDAQEQAEPDAASIDSEEAGLNPHTRQRNVKG